MNLLKRWRRLLARSPGQKDRLDATRRPHAGSLWSCFPSGPLRLKLQPLEFSLAAKVWLGQPVYSDGGTGLRALLESSSSRITRHDAIRDVIFEACKAAGLRPWRERTVDATGHRPGDVYLPNWSLGRPLAADVTVSHPSQANATTTQAEGEVSASKRAASQAADAKVRKHGARCSAAGVDFLPLAVCTFGGWLPEGVKFVSAVARRLAEHTGQSQSVVASQLWQRLSVTLWRTNAWIIQHRAPRADCEAWDLPGYARASPFS